MIENAGITQLELFLILDALLILYLLRPKKSVIYHMGTATRSFNGQRRMYSQGDMWGIVGLRGRNLPNPSRRGPLTYAFSSLLILLPILLWIIQ